MDSMSYNYNMDDQKPIFTTASDTKATSTTESFAPERQGGPGGPIGHEALSPLAAQFQVRGGNDLLNLLAQQEPRAADTAPSEADIMNYNMGSDLLFDDIDRQSSHNYYMGSRTDSVASSHNMWSEGSSAGGGGGAVSAARSGEMIDTFDFLVKSLSSANNYVSMLTREQLSVLRSIRPSLLYEFLQEVAKVRGDKRLRRALPNECAFCKNNGENEECYGAHALKDWRGRVLCPVLRAFRCPRCGATGDRAHTIKYCPDNSDVCDRAGPAPRRRSPPQPLVLAGPSGAGSLPHGSRTPQPPAPSPTAGFPVTSLWSNYGIN